MALALRFFTCVILMVCIIASVDAAIKCDIVTSILTPCANYLSKGGVVPAPCCEGVKKLTSLAQTTPDRQQACQCIQSVAKGISGLNPSLASDLPKKCGVSIPYPISMSTNCKNIK